MTAMIAVSLRSVEYGDGYVVKVSFTALRNHLNKQPKPGLSTSYYL